MLSPRVGAEPAFRLSPERAAGRADRHRSGAALGRPPRTAPGRSRVPGGSASVPYAARAPLRARPSLSSQYAWPPPRDKAAPQAAAQ